MNGGCNDEIYFPHKLLLIDRHISKPCRAFRNNSLAAMNLFKSQLSKIVQSGGFLGILLGTLMKSGFTIYEKCS